MDETTVWMITGNKGGVGKSVFCTALASAFEMRQESYAVFDGDGRTGDIYKIFNRKVPARWGDFRELRPESHNCPLDEIYERTLHQLLKGCKHLIVNTPDGADKVLAKWFDVTLRHTESQNRQFKCVYIMSDRPDGLDMLPMLESRFLFLYPIRNLHFGKVEQFGAFNRDYLSHFHHVIDFPAMRYAEARILFDQSLHPIETLRTKVPGKNTFLVSSLSRTRFLNWQCAVNEAIDNMIENRSMPNIKKSSESAE